MQVDRDIALVIDRSGSMGWTDYNWPSGFSEYSYDSLNAGVDAGVLYTSGGWYYYSPGENWSSYIEFLHDDHLGLGATTPWGNLVKAVDTFLNVLETTDQNEQVSLASYATSSSVDHLLVTNYDDIRTELNSLSPDGATAIGLGIQSGITTLLDGYARDYAAKTMVVMTDGVHNEGISPTTAAAAIVAAYDVTIHTVTFGSGADERCHGRSCSDRGRLALPCFNR